MNIYLSGVNTKNKGAELMLCAIIKEIEKKYPSATVYIPNNIKQQDIDYLNSSLKFRHQPIAKIGEKFRAQGVLKKFKLPYAWFISEYPLSSIDYFFDASGYTFTDSWHHTPYLSEFWEMVLKHVKSKQGKIIFLPQAFGPANEKNTINGIRTIGKYANLIFARENISYDCLVKCGINSDIIKNYPDFTISVQGYVPDKYSHLRNSVCIIPNKRMIDRGITTKEKYINFYCNIINTVNTENKTCYLLNHEGVEDLNLAKEIKKCLNSDIDIVTNLNALEIKGLISSSYLCISSRFHGVSSALNSKVPCLATSWSHKYEKIFEDFNQKESILDINNITKSRNTVLGLLNEETNKRVRLELEEKNSIIKSKNEQMWNLIWNY